VSARSYLYVPGDQPDKIAKALTRGADAVIFDLEDAVPHERKDEARDAVVGFLGAARGEHHGEVWVRVNPGALLEADVAALSQVDLDGISLPKASVAQLERLDHLLVGRDVAVSALVETAAALFEVRAIASAPRVARLQLGEADLSAELGIEASPDGREFASIRTQIVLASAAAGLAAPIGPISTDFHDRDGLRASSLALRKMGFGARAAIHPLQIPVINDVFTPSAEEVAAAQDIVDRFDTAAGGVTIDGQGRMIDEPIVRAARRVLARAQIDRRS
jgi:citrate lyase subunit beta/citryl-CoA lyase